MRIKVISEEETKPLLSCASCWGMECWGPSRAQALFPLSAMLGKVHQFHRFRHLLFRPETAVEGQASIFCYGVPLCL